MPSNFGLNGLVTGANTTVIVDAMSSSGKARLDKVDSQINDVTKRKDAYTELFDKIKGLKEITDDLKDDKLTKDSIKDFVSKLNEAQEFINDKNYYRRDADKKTYSRGEFFNDSNARQIKSDIQKIVKDNNLKEFGINIDRSGVVSIDSDKLSATLSNETSKASLQERLQSVSGVKSQLSSYYTKQTSFATGTYKKVVESSESKLKKLELDRDAQQKRYDQMRESYLKQMNTMESQVSKYQGIQGYIGNFFNQNG